MRNYLIIIVSLVTLTVVAQQPAVNVANFFDGKKCALSYTFDDGLADQYSVAAPALEKHGWRGTFFVNPGKVNGEGNARPDTTRMTWTEIEDLAARGHEISNHGWRHRNFAKTKFSELKADIDMGDSAIAVHIGHRPLTFAYPGNVKDGPGMGYVAQGRIGTRLRQSSVGKKNEANLHKWMRNALKKGEWQVGMTHGLLYGYDAFVDPAPFIEHLDSVKAHEDEIWVAPFCDVCAYVALRDSMTLDVTYKGQKIIVTPHHNLNPTIFTQLITLEITDINVKKATQNKKSLTFLTRGRKTFINFDPNGDTVIIEYQ